MKFAYSPDGVTIVKIGNRPEPGVNSEGDNVMVNKQSDEAILNSIGWYRLVEDTRPADTATGTFVPQDAIVAGVATRTWSHSPAEHALRLDANERDQDAADFVTDFQALKDMRDAAAQSRADMDPAEGLGRWTRDITVAGTGDTVRLEQRSGHHSAEIRKLHGDIRFLSAAVIRMSRALGLDG